MGNALCTIKYELDGRQYQTIHGLHSGVSTAQGQNTFTEADLTAWGFDQLGVGDLDGRTDVQNQPFNWGSLIEGIISFHRFMQSSLVTLKQVYISDGFTPGISTGPFATFDLNLQCQSAHTPSTIGDIAPANVALLIDKTSGMFSRRGGRMWLRGATGKGGIQLGGPDGVELTAAGRSVVSAALTDFLTASSLGGEANTFADYFDIGVLGADSSTTVQYSIPNTTKVIIDGKTRRALTNWTSVGTFAIDDAQSRDTRRRGPRRA